MEPPRTIRRWLYSAALILIAGAGQQKAAAQCPYNSGSTGAGSFAPTMNTTVPLPPDGILNYTTVNIPSGVTVKYQRNAKNTPVRILASGNVTITGTIDVSGEPGVGAFGGAGGPGGFDGGMGGTTCGGAGLGPGGGLPGCGGTSARRAGAGGFGTAGESASSGGGVGGSTYGNRILEPLIGGSGGGGSNSGTVFGDGGGGGGGAILIASGGTINVAGSVIAAGGSGVVFDGGSGSGGAIRLVANALAGNGTLSVVGGDSIADGGDGRIRLEACELRFSGTLPAVADSTRVPAPAFTGEVPTLMITLVEGTPVPTMPGGSFALAPDITLPSGTASAHVELAATGLPPGTMVDVIVTPQKGLPAVVTSTALTGSQENSTASADVSLTPGLSIIGAQALIPAAQPGSAPLVVGSIDGERIDKVRVATNVGGQSSLTYVTSSGRNIPANLPLRP